MPSPKTGFTLLELSIVLVILGLIVGGVLVGKDLITQATIRSTISQIEEVNSATSAFRLKYHALPGDISPASAASFGLFSPTAPAIAIFENRNYYGYCSVKGLMFWRHLSEVGLVHGQYGMVGNSALDPVSAQVSGPVTNFSDSYMETKLGNSFMQPFNAYNNKIYLYTGGLLELNTGYCTPDNGSISPLQIHAMDTKLDDGRPNTGNLRAYGGFAATPTSGACFTNAASQTDAAAQYNVTAEYGTTRSCTMYAPFQ